MNEWRQHGISLNLQGEEYEHVDVEKRNLRSEEASSRLISEDEKKNYYLLYF
jgi:hypothetical protein